MHYHSYWSHQISIGAKFCSPYGTNLHSCKSYAGSVHRRILRNWTAEANEHGFPISYSCHSSMVFCTSIQENKKRDNPSPWKSISLQYESTRFDFKLLPILINDICHAGCMYHNLNKYFNSVEKAIVSGRKIFFWNPFSWGHKQHQDSVQRFSDPPSSPPCFRLKCFVLLNLIIMHSVVFFTDTHTVPLFSAQRAF